MAKYRHRIFEMYEFHDEATRALTPKTVRPVTETTAPESWTFTHLAVSRSSNVLHVRFKSPESLGGETVSDLRAEIAELSGKLEKDSKVLFDFAGVKSFCDASINALELFNRDLRTKGSRIALCRLAPGVKQSFFAWSNGHEKRK